MLTDSQIAILAADMAANPALAAFITAGDDVALANYYNESVAEEAWKTKIELSDIFDVLDWTSFIGRSQGERDAFRFMFTNGMINPSQVNVRTALDDIFSGGQPAAVAQRDAITALNKRTMNRVEKLFATGPVDGVYTLSVEGSLSYTDASRARVPV